MLRLVVQRLQRDDELRGRAIGIGDDVLLAVALGGVGVDLRHDQRHVGVHAPGRGIVDDDAALRADLRRPFLRHRAARRHQADVGRREVVVLERLALEDAIAERDLLADRARRRQRDDFGDGETALGENLEHLAADIAGGARHRDLEALHEKRSFRSRLPPIFPPLAGGLLDAPPGGGAGAEGAVNPSRRLSWRRAICSSFSSREAASQGSELRRRERRDGRWKTRCGGEVNAADQAAPRAGTLGSAPQGQARSSLENQQ